MNKIQSIAIRIALIQEEYRDADIQKAVKLLETHGSPSLVTDYLKSRLASTSMDKVKRKVSTCKPNEHHSKAVLDLAGVDDEKYSLLLEFENLIRRGEILRQLNDIRRLGEKLDKNFVNPRSRREAINNLMVVISHLPINDIKDIIDRSITSVVPSNEYQDLAQYLIEGKHSGT